MDAIRVNAFGGPESLRLECVPTPTPGDGEVLVRVVAAGVGPWDAWVRTGQSVINQALPLTPGADLAGLVTAVGPGVNGFHIGDPVFGVTNAQFTGAYAEYAVAAASMLAPKPHSLPFIAAASLPVVACTAWQMVFDHGQADGTKRVLVHGAAGNVGAYAVQLARRVAKEVVATAFPADLEYVRTLGAHQVIDATACRFEEAVSGVDIVLDTVGGETLDRSFSVLAPGGVLVSSVETPDPVKASQHHVRGVFFLVRVSSPTLARLADLVVTGELVTAVGTVLPLTYARLAHEMLAGKPHSRGKIVLTMSD